MQVKDHKPANIKIYDYYMPGEFRCCTAKTAQIYFWKKKKNLDFVESKTILSLAWLSDCPLEAL